MTFDHLPPELTARPQWVCRGKPGKPGKIPYHPGGAPAKAGQPGTWGSFGDCAAAVQAGRFAGLGFEFDGGGIVGVDFDHCIQDGQLNPWAAAWVERFASYTEISPSGTGLHILCKGALPGKSVKRPRAEMYDRDRYFTITGAVYGSYSRLQPAQEAVIALYKELQAETRKAPDKPTEQRTALPMAPGKDYLQIGLEKDPRFAALWRGDRPNGDESGDDIALMNKLAHWCNCEPAAMRSAFLASGHYATKDEAHKKKAGRPDYLNRTITRAVKDCPGTAAEDDAAYLQSRAQETGKQAGKDKGNLLAPMSTVEARKASYLISPYLPRGMLVVMGGVSGMGKTWLALSWAAAVSKGQRLPFQRYFEAAPPAGFVYYFTQENDPNTVIRPRLDLMDANLDKILIQAQSGAAYDPITLNDHRLDEATQLYPPALIIFDPIQSYLGAKVEMNKANEVRPILDWLGDYCKRHDCTTILVSHMSKPGMGNSSALDRLLGSSDFRNAARSIIIVGGDPEDKESRVFAHAKNSIGIPGPSQRYHIDGTRGVVYDGECDLTADDLVKQAQPGTRAKPAVTLTQARKMLEELLGADGFATIEQIETLQMTAGVSQATFYRVKKEMALQTISIGRPPKRQTWWLLPEVDAEKFKQTHTPPPKQLPLK